MDLKDRIISSSCKTEAYQIYVHIHTSLYTSPYHHIKSPLTHVVLENICHNDNSILIWDSGRTNRPHMRHWMGTTEKQLRFTGFTTIS